jgi:tetratricopeptide (TPR) repeat protein
LVTGTANILVPYYAVILLTIVATGAALLLGERLPGRTLTGIVGLLLPGLAAVTLGLIVTTNTDVVKADIYHKQGRVSQQKGRYDQAIALYRRALELEPGQDFYYLFLGEAMLELGRLSKPPEVRDGLFREAEKAITRARDLNPLRLDHTANLARLYRLWAEHTDEKGQRAELFQKALAFYAKATTRNPQSVLLWNEWGKTYSLMGNHDRAREKYEQALALDDDFVATYLALGDLYRAQGKWKEASKAYEQAVARQPDSIQGHSALGAVYSKMGLLADAVRENQRVLQLAPDNLATHRNLAHLYRAMGRASQALVHAQRALELAPPKDRAAIEKVIEQLRNQKSTTP